MDTPQRSFMGNLLPSVSLASPRTEFVLTSFRQSQVNCKDGPSFTYDQVYGGGAQPSAFLYEQCVQPLVNGLFKGYNACCFAYGQTGSGKTYTMGSSTLMAGPSEEGVIPKVMQDIFQRIAAAQDTDFTVRVGFVEIFNVCPPPSDRSASSHCWSNTCMSLCLVFSQCHIDLCEPACPSCTAIPKL